MAHIRSLTLRHRNSGTTEVRYQARPGRDAALGEPQPGAAAATAASGAPGARAGPLAMSPEICRQCMQIHSGGVGGARHSLPHKVRHRPGPAHRRQSRSAHSDPPGDREGQSRRPPRYDDSPRPTSPRPCLRSTTTPRWSRWTRRAARSPRSRGAMIRPGSGVRPACRGLAIAWPVTSS